MTLILDSSSFQDSTNTTVPLLTVRKNASSEDAKTQLKSTHNEAVTTSATTTRHIADEPVVLPDDSVIQFPSEKNDAVLQLTTKDNVESVAYPTAADASVTETTATDQSMLPGNETAAQEPNVDVDKASHPLNTTGIIFASI